MARTSAWRKVTSVALSWAFWRAMARASGEMSTAVTSAAGKAFFSAMAMQPLPVQRSRMRGVESGEVENGKWKVESK